MTQFQWEMPCDPSELVYFRRRIGEGGVALILSVSARLHGEQSAEPTVVKDIGHFILLWRFVNWRWAG